MRQIYIGSFEKKGGGGGGGEWFATTYSFVTNFSDNSKQQNILFVTIYARLIHSLPFHIQDILHMVKLLLLCCFFTSMVNI